VQGSAAAAAPAAAWGRDLTFDCGAGLPVAAVSVPVGVGLPVLADGVGDAACGASDVGAADVGAADDGAADDGAADDGAADDGAADVEATDGDVVLSDAAAAALGVGEVVAATGVLPAVADAL
jgi:hypothetical protein